MGSSWNGSDEPFEVASTSIKQDNSLPVELSNTFSIGSKSDATTSVSERAKWVSELVKGCENAIKKSYQDRFNEYPSPPESERPSSSEATPAHTVDEDFPLPEPIPVTELAPYTPRMHLTPKTVTTLNRAHRCGLGELHDGKKEVRAVQSCRFVEGYELQRLECPPDEINNALAAALKANEEEKSKR
ncbi:hypothetical protein QFC19_001827 [Naganishia cerealis]|uniref:Uncharacterized protein n=1 Tax=Naganishia cerealis TaxID=610337 RepID=A0ACC2WEL3_9TREE|nr:hypothetical protein QFC19_001827 [Naganishia cerealis]